MDEERVLKGLFVPSIARLSAELGLAFTDGASDLSSLRLRARCLRVLERAQEASPLVRSARLTVEQTRAIRQAKSEFDNEGLISRSALDALVRAAEHKVRSKAVRRKRKNRE